jgi:hypothetical protein
MLSFIFYLSSKVKLISINSNSAFWNLQVLVAYEATISVAQVGLKPTQDDWVNRQTHLPLDHRSLVVVFFTPDHGVKPHLNYQSTVQPPHLSWTDCQAVNLTNTCCLHFCKKLKLLYIPTTRRTSANNSRNDFMINHNESDLNCPGIEPCRVVQSTVQHSTYWANRTAAPLCDLYVPLNLSLLMASKSTHGNSAEQDHVWPVRFSISTKFENLPKNDKWYVCPNCKINKFYNKFSGLKNSLISQINQRKVKASYQTVFIPRIPFRQFVRKRKF